MIVLQIINTIESAYNRAYQGEERESLRTARVVTQADQMNQHNLMQYQAQQKQNFSFLKPSTWVK